MICLKGDSMIKVVVFGTGSLSGVLLSGLNDNVEVIAYSDNDVRKWNTYYNKKKVINPQEIKKYKFDYVLIGSQYNEEIYKQLLTLEIEESKVFEFTKFLDMTWDHVEYCLNNAISNSKSIETIVTGLSYAHVGFNEEIYNKSANLANVSQDLFYDYNMLKYLFENYNFENVNKVIMGLSYYSFQYDLSRSSMQNKGALYYKNIKVKHHESGIDKLKNTVNKNEIIARNIFKYIGNRPPIFNWKTCNEQYIINEEMGRWQAELDCNKDYPQTVKENISILIEYISYLKKKDIQPIIIVFPATKYYTKYFSKKIEEEFDEIILSMKKDYNVRYLDYFRSELFDDKDFKDVSHLNKEGADKFTKILKHDIEIN